MTKEELEKYLNEEVEITLDKGELTYKGKLIKRSPEFMRVICDAYGVAYKDDWFTLIVENKESFNLRPEVIKKIKRLKCKL